jgi:hypothetical protein
MLRKNQRSCLLNEFQLRLFKWTNERLTRLNRAAFCELRRIRSRHLSNRQCSEAGEVFRTIAIQMISTLQLRQEILIAGREQQPQQILLVIGTRCETCAENRGPSNADDEESASREALEQDSGLQTEIDPCWSWCAKPKNACHSARGHGAILLVGFLRASAA